MGRSKRRSPQARASERARRAARGAQRRALQHQLKVDLGLVVRPGPRKGTIYEEPPEGLIGEDLDNWHAEQRIARRVARLEAACEAYEQGQTYVPGGGL